MITSPVYDPAHSGDVQKVDQWLNEHVGQINEPISDGYTLLHVACMFGHRNLVSFLLGKNALVNVNADNESRATGLHLAVVFRVEEAAADLARMLIGNGAELNVKDANGETPLHHAVARCSELLVATLIEAGADPYLKDNHGRSPIDLAKAPESNSDKIREILKRANHLH